jgi:hypothetical protein
MLRALGTLLLAPLLVGLLFGVYAFVAMPIMLAVAVAMALPLFLILRHYRWLQWWHACAAGALCGLAFAALYWNTSSPYHIEFTGVQNALFFVGVGTLVGLVFWWLGIFRNRVFPYVSPQLPKSMLTLLPIMLGGVWLYEMLEPQLVEGRVLSILEPAQTIPERSGKVTLRLTNGSIVVASLPKGLANPSPVNACFSLSERWSATLLEKVYFLHVQKFGKGSDDC